MISDVPQLGINDLAFFIEALLRTNWESPLGPMRLAGDLTSQEVSSSRFFLNCRIFLEALTTEETPATATAISPGHSSDQYLIAWQFQSMRSKRRGPSAR